MRNNKSLHPSLCFVLLISSEPLSLYPDITLITRCRSSANATCPRAHLLLHRPLLLQSSPKPPPNPPRRRRLPGPVVGTRRWARWTGEELKQLYSIMCPKKVGSLISSSLLSRCLAMVRLRLTRAYFALVGVNGAEVASQMDGRHTKARQNKVGLFLHQEGG